MSLEQITIRTANTCEESREFARLALENRLFIPREGYMMAPKLQYIKIAYSLFDISLAYVGNTIVGVAVKDGLHVMFFVKKAYRRMGIGTRLANCVKAPNIYAFEGLKRGSDKFFESVGIELIF